MIFLTSYVNDYIKASNFGFNTIGRITATKEERINFGFMKENQ